MPPMKTPPLTAEMQAAINRLVRTQSVALVRVGSQWWSAEADCAETAVPFGDWGEVDGRFRPKFPAFQTSTVRGLVRRGVLRMKGPKRKTLWPPYKADHFRAEFRYN